MLHENESGSLRQDVLELAQVDKVLPQLSELLSDSIVICEPVICEVFICWVLDGIKSAHASVVSKVFALPLICLEMNEVRLVLYHELVQLVELLLCLLVVHLVLVIVSLKEQVLLVCFEHACLFLLAP